MAAESYSIELKNCLFGRWMYKAQKANGQLGQNIWIKNDML